MKVVTLAFVTIFYALTAHAKDLSLYCIGEYEEFNIYTYTLTQYKYVDGWFSDDVISRTETSSTIFRPKGSTERQGVVFDLPTDWGDFCPKERYFKQEIFKNNDEQVAVVCTDKRAENLAFHISFSKARARKWALYNGKMINERECNFDRKILLHNNLIFECEPLDDCYHEILERK